MNKIKQWLAKAAPSKRGSRSGRSLISRQPYSPGTLGLSDVSERIKRDNSGFIYSRRERKQIAKNTGRPFIAYYN